MTVRIHFDRTTGDAWWCDIEASGPPCSDSYFHVVRVLVGMGMPDQDVVFIDERGLPCMVAQSLHQCAARYIPTDVEAMARKIRLAQERAERERKAA